MSRRGPVSMSRFNSARAGVLASCCPACQRDEAALGGMIRNDPLRMRPVLPIDMQFGAIAVAAGQPIMEIYAKGAAADFKPDGSPVTEADMLAETLILARLAEYWPDVPVVAEESMAAGQCGTTGERFILVDPLDGTKEFIHRRDEFTVNIALIEQGRPVAGAIYAPALGKLWIGGQDGARSCMVEPGAALPPGSDWVPITTRPWPGPDAVGVASRSHADAETDAFLARMHIAERRSRGSSLKFCLLAKGEADLYPRFGPTMEWDIAAGHAILSAAGGCVTDVTGRDFRYGKCDAGFRNGPFIAWGDPRFAHQSLLST